LSGGSVECPDVPFGDYEVKLSDGSGQTVHPKSGSLIAA
jgi:hypothetical protein